MKATLSPMLFTTTALVLGSLSVARADLIPQTTCGNLSTEVFAPNTQVVINPGFTDIANFTIIVGGNVNSCIIVSFTAAVGGINPNQPVANVRVLLDQTKIAGNTPLGFQPYPASGVTTYNFVFTNVPPGDHSLRIQASVSGLDQPFIADSVAVISHM